MRSDVGIVGACLVVFGGGMSAALGEAPGDRLSRLQVLTSGYPRAYFFRASEGMAANPRIAYEAWDKTFSRLMGIQGKVLEEELPGRSKRNPAFFARFKRRHPDQLVLLHYNGNARDPRDAPPDYFAGHWVYYDGAKILSDVPAETGETDIRVSDAGLFRVNIGRYRTSNEDVGLCVLDDDGRPDWSRCEQVQLVAVNAKRRTLRVRRGCYGTTPRAFRSGKSYAAAHVSEGPWGKRSHLMWYYNYSPRCPKDSKGRTCADVLVDELVRRFGPGGVLETFDGLEFDVLHHRPFGAPIARGGRGADCDADGRADRGFHDGVNEYGIGVVEFCRQLRGRLGDSTLILADGTSVNSQRAFGILNGIESEGWPTLSDWRIDDWSGGLNRHAFWQQTARPPALNYINHKFTTAGPTPGSRVRPDVPWKVHRLVLAAAQFVDAAVCYSWVPPAEDGERFGIWDELRMGVEHRLGWLGRPLAPAVRMARSSPDLLRGNGRRMDAAFVQQFTGDGVRFSADKRQLRIHSTNFDGGNLSFRLRDVPCGGPDLFVSVTMRGDPMSGHPETMARLSWVGIAPPPGALVTASLPETGMRVRGQAETALDPGTGAFLRFFPRRTFAGESHDAYMVHPPYRGGVGYAFWQRDVHVPEDGRIGFHLGMGEKAPKRSDGVTFKVLIAPRQNGRTGPFSPVFEATQVESRWTHHVVPLKAWAGRSVRLRFVCDCGPRDNATTDHAHWGDVRVLGPDGTKYHTPAVRTMTWTGSRAFTSGFYFRDVRSRRIDLAFEVEGDERVWLSDLTVHAHPDVVYREFERGVVLANPSDRDFTFDLDALFPGRAFRRLRGSSRQDPAANDGSAVSGKLTLQSKEGLFLVRVPPG